jgi:hypothetical protein
LFDPASLLMTSILLANTVHCTDFITGAFLFA